MTETIVYGGEARLGMRKRAAMLAALIAMSMTLFLAPVVGGGGSALSDADAGMTCNNFSHLHWGTRHYVGQTHYNNDGTHVRYWWSETWAGTGQTYVGAIQCVT